MESCKVWKLLFNSCWDKSSINGFSMARQLKRLKMPISETRINFHNWKKIWMKNEVDTSSTSHSAQDALKLLPQILSRPSLCSVHAVHSSTCTTWRPCYTTQRISNTMNIDLQHLLYACITQIHTVPKRACIGPNHNHYLKVTHYCKALFPCLGQIIQLYQHVISWMFYVPKILL